MSIITVLSIFMIIFTSWVIINIAAGTPYEKGQDAAEDGLKIYDNPYDKFLEYENFIEWKNGFNSYVRNK